MSDKMNGLSYITHTVLDDIVGLYVREVWISDYYLTIKTNGRNIHLTIDADCCSESWFSDIIGVDKIYDKKINDIKELNLDNYNVDDGRCRQECDSVYGFRLYVDDNNYADFIYRNSSNGYYGGSLRTFDPSWNSINNELIYVEDNWYNNSEVDKE